MLTTIEELKGAGAAELERAFAEAPLGPEPRGRFRGAWLRWVGGAPALPLLPLDALLFRLTPFGIDFDRRVWWFGGRRLGVSAGRFTAREAASRWRPARVLALEYAPSALPIRGLLYDEIKPLAAGLCLGLGGLNAGPRLGAHFFFALTREA